MNYEDFLNYLKQFDTTKEILEKLYIYFANHVTYNYDQLQVVKLLRGEEPQLRSIQEFLYNNQGVATPEFKEELIKKLDEAFMELEGRPLSERNREEWFKDYGKVVHHEAIEASTFISKKTKRVMTMPYQPAHDEVKRLTVDCYEPKYENGLLVDGVCSDYSTWVIKLLTDLNIPCLRMIGKGTTGHSWVMVYLSDKNEWVNFDMTMVRFYLDDWTRDYGKPTEWVTASTEEMFNNQPNRTIERIADAQDEVVFNGKITKDNLSMYKEHLFGILGASGMQIK